MKKRGFTLPVLTFFGGTLIGLSLFAVLSFMSAPSPGPISAISPADAHRLFSFYFGKAKVYNDKVNALTIDKTQLDAMNTILQANRDVAGFRIYMGADSLSDAVNYGIVVGFDANGKDVTAPANSIYRTDAVRVGLCPPTCDNNSPINH